MVLQHGGGKANWGSDKDAALEAEAEMGAVPCAPGEEKLEPESAQQHAWNPALARYNPCCMHRRSHGSEPGAAWRPGPEEERRALEEAGVPPAPTNKAHILDVKI